MNEIMNLYKLLVKQIRFCREIVLEIYKNPEDDLMYFYIRSLSRYIERSHDW